MPACKLNASVAASNSCDDAKKATRYVQAGEIELRRRSGTAEEVYTYVNSEKSYQTFEHRKTVRNTPGQAPMSASVNQTSIRATRATLSDALSRALTFGALERLRRLRRLSARRSAERQSAANRARCSWLLRSCSCSPAGAVRGLLEGYGTKLQPLALATAKRSCSVSRVCVFVTGTRSQSGSGSEVSVRARRKRFCRDSA